MVCRDGDIEVRNLRRGDVGDDQDDEDERVGDETTRRKSLDPQLASIVPSLRRLIFGMGCCHSGAV